MITITDKASEKVKTLQEKESKVGYALRLKVVGGGCSGYSYGLDFDQNTAEGDAAFESNGVKIVVDPKSLPMIDNCEVDWLDAMTGAGFTIKNPNAKGSCGCGSSFTV
jgi:iron-sulfur cluster assembly accessory protein